ncbi:MAG: MFS transporter [Chloroflexi bacterium]|nr:MFS transporter [Chloroflexota bacterium]
MTGDRGPANLGEIVTANHVSTSAIEPRRARIIVYLLAASVAIVMTGFGIIMPVFARRLDEFGSGVSALGLMTTAFALSAFVAAPFMGTLADRIGRKPLVLLSLGSFVAVNIAFLFARSTEAFIAVRVVEGALSAGLMPAAMGIVADIVPEEERAQRVGVVMGAMGSGIILGPVIGGILYDLQGFEAVFMASAAMAFGAFVFALILVPETRTREIRRREKLRMRRESVDTQAQRQSIWASMPRPLHLFGTLLFIDFVIIFEYTFIEPQMIFYFYNTLDWSTIQFGVIVAVTGIFIVVGQALLGKYSDRIGRKPVIVVGALLFTALPGALAFVTSFPLMMVFAAVAGLGLALIMPALNAFYIDMTAERHRSRVQGLKASSGSLGGVFGPLVLAGVTTFMTPKSIFLVAAGLMLLMTLVALVALREPPRATEKTPGYDWQWTGGRAVVAQATLRGLVARARGTGAAGD